MKTINQLLDQISKIPEAYHSNVLKGWKKSLLEAKEKSSINGDNHIINSANIEFEIQECRKEFDNSAI